MTGVHTRPRPRPHSSSVTAGAGDLLQRGPVALAESPPSLGLSLPLGTKGDGRSFLFSVHLAVCRLLGSLSGLPTLSVQSVCETHDFTAISLCPVKPGEGTYKVYFLYLAEQAFDRIQGASSEWERQPGAFPTVLCKTACTARYICTLVFFHFGLLLRHILL